MSNTLLSVNKEKVLSQERYDEKLFKQAYKAGLEAKEMEKKKKKRNLLMRIFISFFSILLVSVGIYLLLSLRKEKIEYTESLEIPRSLTYDTVEYEVSTDETYLDISPKNISALSALVYNPENGYIIYEKDIHTKRQIASITKLLSVLVALDTYDLEEVIEVDTSNIPEDLSWTLGLEAGDRIKVDYLLKSMLISSYNDTAYILANAYPNGGYKGFVEAMNVKAFQLRMVDSKFDNPAGLDSENNISTAYDVALLARASLNKEYILEMVNKGSTSISWYEGEELKDETISSTNQLYGVNKYVRGLKTGITDLAGQCFVGYFVYSNEKKLVTVVLNSQDRFTDTQNLERLSRDILER